MGQMIVSDNEIDADELLLISEEHPELMRWLVEMVGMRFDTYNCVSYEQYREASDKNSLRPK